MKKYLMILVFMFCNSAFAQKSEQDTLKNKINNLDEVVIKSKISTISKLNDVHGTYIFAAKKSEIIKFNALDVNTVDNNPRQIFAKVPGVFVFETDGTGNALNIATRGLTAHRSWEINTRLNGVMTNSDIYGYPASHFNAPMESLDRIEVVRGSGSLQYGAQFGGMINFVSKEIGQTKPFAYQTQNAIGSFGLRSTSHAIGGKINKFKYQAYYNYRAADGYRDNSDYHYSAFRLAATYDFTKNLSLKTEFNKMNYVNHVNGGLTDAEFKANPRMSTRNRNYYSPTIYIPSVIVDYKINDQTKINFASSVILGDRSSILFIAPSHIKDTLYTKTGQYNPRQVDIDNYHSYSNELRIVHDFWLGKSKNTLLTGIRYINNDLVRKQLGKGTTGTNYDLTLTSPIWGRDLSYKSKGISVFMENLLAINQKLSVTAGIRYENASTHMTGTINYYDAKKVPMKVNHNFALLDFGAEYHILPLVSIYGNFAQAYRPVIMSDLIPTNALNTVNPDLKDGFGNNTELGIRGEIFNDLRFDMTFFTLTSKIEQANW